MSKLVEMLHNDREDVSNFVFALFNHAMLVEMEESTEWPEQLERDELESLYYSLYDMSYTDYAHARFSYNAFTRVECIELPEEIKIDDPCLLAFYDASEDERKYFLNIMRKSTLHAYFANDKAMEAYKNTIETLAENL